MKFIYTLFLSFLSLGFFIPALNGQSPNSWRQVASMPGVSRQEAVSFTANGFAFVGIGIDSAGNYLNDFYKYNPITDSWSSCASFPGVGRRGAVGFSVNDTGYVATGSDGNDELKDCWQYIPSTDSWNQVQDIGTNLAVSCPGRSHASAVAVGNLAYLFCGYDGSPGYLKQTLRFDPSNDTSWAIGRNLGNVSDLTLYGRRWGSAFAIGGSVYYGTGFSFSQDIKKDVWRYDPAIATWTQIADFGGNIRSNAFAFSLYGRGYIGGGTNGNYSSDLWSYSPVTNSWTEMVSFLGPPRVNTVAFTINNRAYVGTGVHTSGTTFSDLWEYTPDSTTSLSETEKATFSVIQSNCNSVIVSIVSESMVKKSMICIYSISGALVKSIALENKVNMISLDDLNGGFYVYTISREEQLFTTGKLIKD
ncbi:MAG: hypothetical protein RIQ47_1403 [Bacteroidota bacterium]